MTAELQRVFVHVGAPKTGTTFLQTVLYDYRDQLREYGVLYPARWYDDHFFAAVDLQDLDFSGERRPEASGRWAVVADRVRSWPGTSVISHDVFAGATAEQANTAVADLAPAEVHITFTARDLARQLPSHWQEDVKHGQTASFAEWYAGVARHDTSDWQLRWFWRVEDIPDVLRRWTGCVPPHRVHLVTMPQQDGPSDLLWRRFASVIGLEPDAVDTSVIVPPNTGLGVGEVELIRRLNLHRGNEVGQADYERAVKGLLAHDTLGTRGATRRFALPQRLFDDVVALSHEWVSQLRGAGYDVIGDLDDLIPVAPEHPAADPDSATDAEVADAAVFALRELVVRAHLDSRRLDELTHEADRLRGEVAALESVVREHRELPHWERVKRTVVEIGRTSPAVGRALHTYRRARRR